MNHKAARLTSLQTIEIEDQPVPDMGIHDVLIKVDYCGVCGSDIHFFEHGRIGNRIVNYPLVLGHEASGMIMAVGTAVTKHTIGENVVIEPGIPCGECELCREGKYNLCSNLRFLSCPPNDGLLQEYVVVPESMVHKIPAGMSNLAGALMEPLAVGMYAVRKGQICAPQTVIILGAGCIGLCTLLCCRQSGASRIIVCDLYDNRLQLAKELGADEVVNASQCDAVTELLNLTGGYGADVVMETAGSQITTAQTSYLVKYGGTIVIVGNVIGDVSYNFRNISTREVSIKTTKRYRNVFPACLALVSNGAIPEEKLLHIADSFFDLQHTQQAFMTAMQHKQTTTKAIVCLSERAQQAIAQR